MTTAATRMRTRATERMIGHPPDTTEPNRMNVAIVSALPVTRAGFVTAWWTDGSQREGNASRRPPHVGLEADSR